VTPPVRIRAVTHADLPAIARIHCAAFPRGALVALGPGAVERYYDWQLEGPHDAIAIVAEYGGAVSGYCFAGVHRGALSGFLRRHRAYLLARVLMRPWLLGSPLFRQRLQAGVMTQLKRRHTSPPTMPPKPPERHFGVLAIAVDPQAEGRGIGTLLMQESERVARERHFPVVALTVEPGNERAVRFYERLGFSKASDEGSWTGVMRKGLEA